MKGDMFSQGQAGTTAAFPKLKMFKAVDLANLNAFSADKLVTVTGFPF